jgi:hypothetical protein
MLKNVILLPNYWLTEINFIIVVYILNSVGSYYLNYILSQRMAMALDSSEKQVVRNRRFFAA